MRAAFLSKYLTLGSVGDVVTQQRPPQLNDFGGGGLRSPIYINGLTGEAFIYLNGAITPLGYTTLTAPVQISANGQTVANATISTSTSGNAVGVSGAFTDVWLRALNILNTAASPNGNGLQINAPASNRWGILGCTFSTNLYGVLANSQAGGSKGLIVSSNFITSTGADCVEINSPATAIEDVIVSANVLNVTAGSGVSAGFAVSFAHVNGGYAVGNISQRSWLEAHHVEDGSKNLGFIGNLAKACQNHGANLLVDGTNAAQAKALPIIGNTYEAPAVTGAQLAGIRVAWTASGSIDGMTIIGNIVRNFDYGLWMGSVVRGHADGNVIDGCTFAMRVDTNAVVTGTNRVIGACSALLFASSATANDIRVGKFVCDTKPTAIITKAAPGTTRPGCSVEGFKFPMPGTALVNGTNQVNLFPVPTRMSGKLRVIAFNQISNVDYDWYCTDIIYDGVSITLSNTIKESGGALGFIVAPEITVSGGQVRIGLVSVGAMTALVECEFDGVYML